MAAPETSFPKTVQPKKRVSEKLFKHVKTKAVPATKQTKKERVAQYYIQAGSFSSMPNKTYLSKIRALGFRYTVRHADNYKVLIGAYKDEKSAREVLPKVRKDISGGAFIVKL
jgi:cell division septation protein DedD